MFQIYIQNLLNTWKIWYIKNDYSHANFLSNALNAMQKACIGDKGY